MIFLREGTREKTREKRKRSTLTKREEFKGAWFLKQNSLQINSKNLLIRIYNMFYV